MIRMLENVSSSCRGDCESDRAASTPTLYGETGQLSTLLWTTSVGTRTRSTPADSACWTVDVSTMPSGPPVSSCDATLTAEIVPMLVPTSHTGTGAAARSAAMSVPTSRAVIARHPRDTRTIRRRVQDRDEE